MLGESSATTFATKMIKSEECSDDMDPPSTLQLQTAPDVTDINIEVKGIEVKLEPPTSYSGLATSGNHYGVRDADGNEKSSATVMHQNSSSDNSVSNINFVFSNPVNPMADTLRNVSSNVISASSNNTSNMVSALSNNTSDIVSASNSNTSDMVFVSSSSTTNMVSALSNNISDVVSASSNNTADMVSASSNDTSDVVSTSSNNTCDVVLLDMVAHNVHDDETNEHNVKNDEVELVNEDIKPERLETMTESKTVLKSKEEKKEDVDESREKTVQCKECKMVFTNPHELEWHVLYSQRNGIPCDFKCDFCREVHETVRKFQHHRNLHFMKCDICNIHFTTLKGGKGHMRIHTGKKPYLCDVCGLDFRYHSQYRAHKRKHEGIVEAKHQCQICGKLYVTRKNLQIHGITHSGEKPFACEVCGKRFTQRSSVKLHMRTHAETEEDLYYGLPYVNAIRTCSHVCMRLC